MAVSSRSSGQEFVDPSRMKRQRLTLRSSSLSARTTDEPYRVDRLCAAASLQERSQLRRKAVGTSEQGRLRSADEASAGLRADPFELECFLAESPRRNEQDQRPIAKPCSQCSPFMRHAALQRSAMPAISAAAEFNAASLSSSRRCRVSRSLWKVLTLSDL
jgi:hypothetical protein